MKGGGCCAQGKVARADLRASAQSSDVVGQEQPTQRYQPGPGGSERKHIVLARLGLLRGSANTFARQAACCAAAVQTVTESLWEAGNENSTLVISFAEEGA